MNKRFSVSLLALSLLALALTGPEVPAQDPPSAESEPLEAFEPTEKLSADSAVSFPVDI